MRPRKPASTPQPDLFRETLEAILDPRHELLRLARAIDWERLDALYGATFVDHVGRPGLPTRLMVGLHLLKHLKGLSDDGVCAAWVENPYFQAFCGETHFQHQLPADRSSMTRWRKRMDLGKLEALLAETIAIAQASGAVTERQLARVTIDTTVQTKAVAPPTDSALMLRAIEWLNRVAKAEGVRLRQSYLRLATRSRREAARLMGGRGHAKAQAHLDKLRRWLGRLIRDLERKVAGDPDRALACAWVLERARRIHAQRPDDTKKLYAFHAPEVECLGKGGMARIRYAFGVKTSFATTNARANGGQFVLGALTCPGGAHDARTLAPQLDQVARVTGTTPTRAYVDRGYRGHEVSRDGVDVYIAQTRGIASPTIRRELRRRSAIEPVIGHQKADGLLERNRLKGAEGDAINALLCAVGHNLRLLLAWFRKLLWLLIALALTAPASTSRPAA
jgi:IS5 family transposase